MVFLFEECLYLSTACHVPLVVFLSDKITVPLPSVTVKYLN